MILVTTQIPRGVRTLWIGFDDASDNNNNRLGDQHQKKPRNPPPQKKATQNPIQELNSRVLLNPIT